MTSEEEVEYYRGILDEAVTIICAAFERDLNDYDSDQADGQCYLDCFEDAAFVIRESGLRWDNDEGGFSHKPSE